MDSYTINSIKVSIIIPVYNCESYLKQCLESIQNQTIKDWEVICIDDGSTDNSINILKEFAYNDSRIHIYSQSNLGAGPARNKGLEVAKGEFIAFLDADDFYLDKEALEVMYETCLRHGVNACGTNLRILRNNKIVEDILFNQAKMLISFDKVYEYRDYQFDYGYVCFIYRAIILKENNIIFPNYRRFQDPVFFIQAMHKIQNFCFADVALYCYRAPNMATRFDKQKLEDLLKGLHHNLQFAQNYNYNLLFNQTIKRIEYEYCEIICNSISETDIQILKLLLRINDLIIEEKNENYVCLPLRKILGSVKKNQESLKEAFITKLYEEKYIVIYGAGQAAIDFLEFLKKVGLISKVKFVLVTNENNNPDTIEGIKVLPINSYIYRQGEFVVVTASGIHYKDIEDLLKKKQVINYCSLNIQAIS